jgi:hypothetical protein
MVLAMKNNHLSLQFSEIKYLELKDLVYVAYIG